MKQTFNRKQKLRQLLIILLPILVTQLAMFSMVFFDVLMSGQASREDLAGVAIGSNIWTPISTGLTGILLAVTPIVAQHIGANRRDQVPLVVSQALFMSLALAVVIIIVGFFVLDPVLHVMDLEAEVEHIARYYLIALAFGIPPLFMYTVLRSFIDALGLTRVTMLITLTSLPINVVLNYFLIFGKMGFPRLGGIGAGVASAATYWIIFLIAACLLKWRDSFSTYAIYRQKLRISLTAWKSLLKVGIPIGLAIFFEVSVFSGVTLLMSRYDTVTIAAHQAAMNFASFLYMIPLSISLALTILVGFEVGSRRFKDARQYSQMAIVMAIVIGLLNSLLLLFFRPQIAAIYTSDAEVLALAQQFLIFALFFMLSDGIAGPIHGALRGYKDVNSTFLATLICFWFIGLPLGHLLSLYTSLAAYGYWVGLIFGLAVSAIILLWRLIIVQRRAARQASVEAG